MSEFGSIDDLLQKEEGGAQTAQPKQAVVDESTQKKLQQKMQNVALKEREIEAQKKATQLGVPHIDLEKFPVSQNALRQVDLQTATTLEAVCFFASGEEIRVGAVNPADEKVKELVYQLEERNHAHGALYLISEHSLKKVLDLYKTLPTVAPITKDVQVRVEDLEKVQASVSDFSSLQKIISESTTTDLVTLMLGAGLKLGTSDVHVEAEETGIVVRLRIDGILHDAAALPKEMYKKLISRLKLLSSLKINITDKPQDGRFTIKMPDGDVDVRVSTIPTVYGESVVMRLLRQNRGGLTLDSLGMSGVSHEALKREIERPNGMVITTGPTGSGKTTTLYASMQLLNKPGVKILTLEDPVEYKMEGINQSQIDHAKGYTFAKGLKSMLRQDPDIVMVGEIRDLETADIAVQAALTGHLILSTIHTNSAAGAIPRFLSMGVKPFLLAPALNAVIGQRLVRKLCDACKKPAVLDEATLARVNEQIERMPTAAKDVAMQKKQEFFAPGGCDECNNIGYEGRVGIYEIFTMNSDIEQMILAGNVSEFEIEKKAIEQGMVTMVQDGILKAMDGMTSIEEVFRVIE